ncbi:MAG: AEC family transporter [Oscillospiraceae bacterium]|nr:AEC family transporter [Oscillospiraceae bacterium]
MTFMITSATVATMLLYAVSGWLAVHFGKVKESSISSFASFLMYVCQPCLTIYCFGKVEYSSGIIKNMLIFFCITFMLMLVSIAVTVFVLKKFGSEVKYRISSLAMSLGNCTFMGVPLVEALLPDYPEAVVYSNVYFFGMSILCWTLASYLITQDKKYISVKKVILNPAVIAVLLSVIMMVTGVELPSIIDDTITTLGKMSTPLCMIVLGMRLASIPVKPIFTSGLQYASAGVKLIIYPLTALLLGMIIPIEPQMAQTLFILSCAPSAAVVLTFSEMLGEGQDVAANNVLLSTILSVVTIPVMMLLAG